MPTELLILAPDARVESGPDGLAVRAPRTEVHLGQVADALREALEGPLRTGADPQVLGETLVERGGPNLMPLYYLALKRLERAGLLGRRVFTEQGALLTICPTAPGVAPSLVPLPAESSWRLSRFTTCRVEDGAFVVASPRSYNQLLLHDDRAAMVLCALARPHTLASLAEDCRLLPASMTTRLLEALVAAGLAEPADANEDPLRFWEPHDLAFHTRTRTGHHRHPYGGTYRFEGTVPPPPPLKGPMSERILTLPRPSLERWMREDPPFARVVEQRASIRLQGDNPLGLEQLGEFLFRTARIRRLLPTSHGTLSNRPYPCGGALYELELYPVVDRCGGLESGLYQYLPQEHALCSARPRTREVEQLLEEAWLTLARECRPQILLVITARFARVSWKYESMAYALILKHVGVLYQTMYLNATAMGLAPCALGGGNSELFAQASGLDAREEASVGEFVLGSMPAQPLLEPRF